MEMKEITRVINAQIILIETMNDKLADDILNSKVAAENNFADDIKNYYHADNVTVVIQDFVLEKKEQENDD
jgi:hypothetical protein